MRRLKALLMITVFMFAWYGRIAIAITNAQMHGEGTFQEQVLDVSHTHQSISLTPLDVKVFKTKRRVRRDLLSHSLVITEAQNARLPVISSLLKSPGTSLLHSFQSDTATRPPNLA